MSFLVFIFFLLLRPPQIVASALFFCLSLRGALERGRKGLCEGEVEEGSARVRANRAVLGRGRKGKREGEEGIARGSARARAKRECEGWRR